MVQIIGGKGADADENGIPKHTNICMAQTTLEFEEKELEAGYQQYIKDSTRRLLLRSVLPSAAFQVIFFSNDYLIHPHEYLHVTIPARLLLVATQLALFGLVYLGAIVCSQELILISSMVYGIATLNLHVLQKSETTPMDALFLTFGLVFYTIPKITPLRFVHSVIGSWLSVGWYFCLATYARPPVNHWENVIALALTIPVVLLYNLVMYYHEYYARVRFVLRDRLNKERISIAISTRQFTSPTSESKGRVFTGGMIVWALLSLAGFSSIHDFLMAPLQTVGADMAWAWFSHVAGISVFMLIVTKQVRWIIIFPICGCLLLWAIQFTIPGPWMLFSAHSVGYSLLGAVALVTLFAFGQYLHVWRQAIRFVKRTCLLYPQLQDGLRKDFPILEQLLRERGLKVNMDHKSQCRLKILQKSGNDVSSTGSQGSDLSSIGYPEECAAAHPQKSQDDVLTGVLPTAKSEQCFFCNTRNAVHFVPCCESWGTHAAWRLEVSKQVERSKSGAKLVMPTESPQPCTPYCEVIVKNKQLETDLQIARWESGDNLRQITQFKSMYDRNEAKTRELESRAMRDQHQFQLHIKERDAEWIQKLESILQSHNQSTHQDKETIKNLQHKIQDLERQLQEAYAGTQ